MCMVRALTFSCLKAVVKTKQETMASGCAVSGMQLQSGTHLNREIALACSILKVIWSVRELSCTFLELASVAVGYKCAWLP